MLINLPYFFASAVHRMQCIVCGVAKKRKGQRKGVFLLSSLLCAQCIFNLIILCAIVNIIFHFVKLKFFNFVEFLFHFEFKMVSCSAMSCRNDYSVLNGTSAKCPPSSGLSLLSGFLCGGKKKKSEIVCRAQSRFPEVKAGPEP